MSPTTTGSLPSSTDADGNSGDNNSSPTSSPLLFFVALGFGVVFTNLWIIVGVKYCFRYNQRNRQLRNEETGEPINLVTMPRTHRRRREKKLMSMDEVNERFPLMKYKAWRSTRADEGLPTAGGISAPTTRAHSLKDENKAFTIAAGGDSPVATSPEKGQHCTVLQTLDNAQNAEAGFKTLDKPERHNHAEGNLSRACPDNTPIKTQAVSGDPVAHQRQEYSFVEDVEDVDDIDSQIRTSMSAELLPNLGDSCAICLDMIEDDDDIRGLTCGHAFHASCVDPWLTSRRACCPLCKADYHVPKPRPDPYEQSALGERIARHSANRMPVPSQPQAVFIGGRSNSFRVPATRNRSTQPVPSRNRPWHAIDRLWRLQNSRPQPSTPDQSIVTPESREQETLGSRLANIRLFNRGATFSTRNRPLRESAQFADQLRPEGNRTSNQREAASFV
ncbi:hypothetical protein P168DRAFT_301933 [Aspergillus campestris IBT 28561]|uniref:RING-type domain-containing protein n=1 Tax=Aspergillus campestris (strain IBT 28561) TaxID=1392248 RepID=A0A2I1DAK1_ASPC2|nr:uncharacterized protein P168DRAFT_301933 [Aspergillus campestris IBT 28561]PKY06908.1 hypothetical protein P168DRAFT_301933 [Aspergillus campestris IBT 28561]